MAINSGMLLFSQTARLVYADHQLTNAALGSCLSVEQPFSHVAMTLCLFVIGNL